MKGFLAFPILLFLLFSTPVSAGFFDIYYFKKGLKAYESGDYATALKEFNPLAEQGYVKAQSKVSFRTTGLILSR